MAARRRLIARCMGRLSEYIIRLCYQSRGYQLRDSNWQIRGGELDLVLTRGEQIVFVEVRARSRGGLVSAVESFDHRKRFHFERCIRSYLHLERCDLPHVRMDLAAVTWSGVYPQIEVVRDVESIDRWGRDI